MTPVVPCGACGRPLPGLVAEEVRCACGCVQRAWRFRPFRRAEPSPLPCLEGADVPCAYHAGNRAEAPCLRCGSFLCALCATPIAGETYCPGCFERLRAGDELPAVRNHVPRPHVAALVLSLVSLVPFVVLFSGALVIWQGGRALRSRRELAAREPRWWGYLAAAAVLVALGLMGTGLILRRVLR